MRCWSFSCDVSGGLSRDHQLELEFVGATCAAATQSALMISQCSASHTAAGAVAAIQVGGQLAPHPHTPSPSTLTRSSGLTQGTGTGTESVVKSAVVGLGRDSDPESDQVRFLPLINTGGQFT